MNGLIGLALMVGTPQPAQVQGIPIVVTEPTLVEIRRGEFELFLPDGTMRLVKWSEAKR